MSFYAVIIAKTAIINYHKYKSGYIEEDCMMRIRKQAFITPSYSIDQDFRIFYYSDIRSSHLHPHVHDFFEMYLLVSGKIMYKTCGIDFFLQPGDILFLNRGQLHRAARALHTLRAHNAARFARYAHGTVHRRGKSCGMLYAGEIHGISLSAGSTK